METLITLKPKIRPYVIMLAAAAVVVIVAALVLAAMYPDYGYVISIVGLLVVLLLAMLVMQQFYRKWYTTYEITENDVISRFGVFAPDEHVVPIDEITNMHVDRSFLGIIFGFGDLQLDTASAKMTYEIYMKDIDSAELNKTVELIRSLMRERRPGSRLRGRPEPEAQ